MLRLHPNCKQGFLSASSKASPIAKCFPAAGTRVLLLSRLEAVLAVHGTIPAGLEWYRGLLPAPGTNYGRTPRFAPLVSPAGLLLFLGLTALFTALRRRISAFIEERLIFSGKRE